MKILIILVDGMRPDAITNIPEAQRILQKSAYTLSATTVVPSVTLPCHVSLFHSVDPLRHGTTTNTYAPQVRPIKGLCELLKENGKNCAFFYGWEELRDLARPGSLDFSYYCSGRVIGRPAMNNNVTDTAIEHLKKGYTDFAFLYLGYTDFAGHVHGWLSDEYMDAIKNSWENIERVVDSLTEEYAVIIVADHGGHDRTHGSEMPEDMLIPVIMMGNGIEADIKLDNVNLKDIAPTITRLMDIEPNEEWEGESLI